MHEETREKCASTGTSGASNTGRNRDSGLHERGGQAQKFESSARSAEHGEPAAMSAVEQKFVADK